MTLPDWLVERAALDEVPAASRDRLEHADSRELATRVAAVRADNAAELAAHPARAAVAQIEARIANRRSTRQRYWVAGALAAAFALAVVVLRPSPTHEAAVVPDEEVTRVKGATRLLAFRLAGERVERLEQDAVVHAGDVIQLRYSAGGQRYGVIASIDGAGIVTLHHPVGEDASPEATALAAKTSALPNAYELDDAPRFERFFFITADAPLDVRETLASLRTLAAHGDGATASPDLPAGLRQWSLRLRKPTP